ncbi:MAG: hypothetical protein NUV44_02410, partial [Candidatus Scalindua sp.]|nr:hypothetical protein [Candidatus Scalindua sp.]
ELCGFSEPEQLKSEYLECIESIISKGGSERDSNWTESIAVGSRVFVEETKLKLWVRVQGRCIEEQDKQCALREDVAPYNVHFDPKKGLLRTGNTHFWESSAIKSMC